jgi:type II secretion system protein H
MRRREFGFSLVELLVVLAIIGLTATLGFPLLRGAAASRRVELAAGEVAGALRLARSHALRFSANVAVRFDTSDPRHVTYSLYRDGDGDGVRNDDIASGTDPVVVRARPLADVGGSVRFGFPPGIVPRDPGDPRRRLDRLDDPIRFNRSDLASFDPLGASTPGSVYLTDGRTRLAVVRLYGRTGKVKVELYDAQREVWY